MRYSIQANGKQEFANTPNEALKLANRMVCLPNNHSYLLEILNKGETACYAYGFAECCISPMN